MSDFERELEAFLDPEKFVIGMTVFQPESLRQAMLDGLESSHFQDQTASSLWTAIVMIATTTGDVQFPYLMESCVAAKDKASYDYLLSCVDYGHSATNVSHWVDQIMKRKQSSEDRVRDAFRSSLKRQEGMPQ